MTDQTETPKGPTPAPSSAPSSPDQPVTEASNPPEEPRAQPAEETAAPDVPDVAAEEPQAPAEAAAQQPAAQAPEAEAPEEDFESLLEASYKAPTQLERGDRVDGVVISIGDEVVLVDLGGKSTGIIDRMELVGEDGELEVKVGDTVEATFLGMDRHQGGMKLSRRLGGVHKGLEALTSAYEARLPVEGTVTARNKGGFDVMVAGQRAFCPISQIEAGFTEDADSHVGNAYSFLVTELAEGGRRIVVSRAALLKQERAERKGELKAHLREGDVVDGTVSNIRDFGAFVDIGGIEGLIHISELSWSRVEKADEVVKIGDKVRVKILGLDWKRDRISLSVKQAQEDPWTLVGDTFVMGERYPGTVVRLSDYGAFVELSPGLDGLLHVSDMTWDRRVRKASDELSVGQRIEVQILNIDHERKRISLGLKQLGEDPWDGVADRYTVGKEIEGTVEKVAQFGLFVSLEPGVTALIPNSEMDTPRGSDHRKDFPVGSTVKAAVLEVDADGRRLTLSRKALAGAAERADFQAYTQREDRGRDDRRPAGRGDRDRGRGGRDRSDRGDRGDRGRGDRDGFRDQGRGAPAAPQGGGFGTLGDLFKDKLKNIKVEQ